MEWCDRYFWAEDQEFPTNLLPEDTGLIISDAYDAAIIRMGQENKLAPTRRKSMIKNLPSMRRGGPMLAAIEALHASFDYFAKDAAARAAAMISSSLVVECFQRLSLRKLSLEETDHQDLKP